MRENFESFLTSRKLDIKLDSYEDLHPLHRFNVRLGPRASLPKLKRLSQELGLELGSLDEPIFTNQYTDGTVQIDVMKDSPKDIFFMAESKEVHSKGYTLPVFLGRDSAGESIDLDLASGPHLLIGGTTGSGKSIMLHSIIASMLPSYKELGVRFAFIDPKRVEFEAYQGGQWNIHDVVHDPKDAQVLVDRLLREMENRFEYLNKKGVRSIADFKNGSLPFPYIVLVIDELSDMMYSSGKKFQSSLIRLAQKSRAAGIHIIAATQHPSSKVIPGELKANFPIVVGCKVMSAIHSRVLFGSSGAERLLGRGDALISGGPFYMKRFKGAYIDPGYAKHIVGAVSGARAKPSLFDAFKKAFR